MLDGKLPVVIIVDITIVLIESSILNPRLQQISMREAAVRCASAANRAQIALD